MSPDFVSSSWVTCIYSPPHTARTTWAPAHVFLEHLVGSDQPLFLPEDLFEAFLAARAEPGPSRIYFNHEIEENVFSRQGDAPTPPDYLPREEDRTWAGYSERVKRATATTKMTAPHYCLRLTEAHAHSHAIYTRLATLLLPLTSSAAFKSGERCVRTTIFMGDYDFTPFGVHVDPYPQIQSVIAGSRSALFWESSAYWTRLANEAVERLAPWRHLDAAKKVTMRAGDAVYWAGDYEHAFSKGAGEFSIAITISFPEVPRAETAIELARRRSAHHFLNVPTRAALDLDLEEGGDRMFRGNPLLPLETVASEGVVGGGCAVEIPMLDDFVARVNSGDPFRLSDFPALGADNARALVDVFYERYCIDAV